MTRSGSAYQTFVLGARSCIAIFYLLFSRPVQKLSAVRILCTPPPGCRDARTKSSSQRRRSKFYWRAAGGGKCFVVVYVDLKFRESGGEGVITKMHLGYHQESAQIREIRQEIHFNIDG